MTTQAFLLGAGEVAGHPDTGTVVSAVAMLVGRLEHRGDVEVSVHVGGERPASGRDSHRSVTWTDQDAGREVVRRLRTAVGDRPEEVWITLACSGCGDGRTGEVPTVVGIRPVDADWEIRTRGGPGTWARFGAERMQTVLARLRAHPGLPVVELVVAGAQERRALDRAQGEHRARPEVTLPDLVTRAADAVPQAVAVSFEGRDLTFTELIAAAEAVARALRDVGVVPGEVVAVCSERCLELPAALLAVMMAGAAYLPVSAEQPRPRATSMLAAAGVRVVLCGDREAALMREAVPDGVLLRLSGTHRAESVREPLRDAVVEPGPHPAYVIFTSGSTGRPKGVRVPHRAIVNRLLWMQDRYGLTGDDVVVQKTPYDFDVSVWEFFWPLVAGTRCLVAPPLAHLDPELLADTLAEAGATVVHFVPCVLEQFLREPAAARCRDLRLLVSSGEPLSPALANRAARILDVEVHNLYGPTEAAVDVTAWACRRPEPGPAVPIGTPLPNVGAHVLSPTGQLVPLGAVGELWLSGVCLASGYAGAPDLTCDRFREVPDADPGHRIRYRTGDLVRWHPQIAGESGEPVLMYEGRIDDQFKVHGVRVEAAEVEHALESFPSVRASVVVVAEVGGREQLVAFLLADGPRPEPAAVRRYVASLLPPAMVPSLIRTIEDFPQTSSGKVDRALLRRQVQGHQASSGAVEAVR